METKQKLAISFLLQQADILGRKMYDIKHQADGLDDMRYTSDDINRAKEDVIGLNTELKKLWDILKYASITQLPFSLYHHAATNFGTKGAKEIIPGLYKAATSFSSFHERIRVLSGCLNNISVVIYNNQCYLHVFFDTGREKIP